METILTQIYNTLSMIETKGDGTLKMAMCLNALNDLIIQAHNKEKEEPEEERSLA